MNHHPDPTDESTTADDVETPATEQPSAGTGATESERSPAETTPTDAGTSDETADSTDAVAEKPTRAEPELPPPAPATPPAPAGSGPATELEDDQPKVKDWYILKVAFNREDSIADALRKRVKMEGMEEFFGDIVVPTEDVATFTRDGKRRVTKRKLLPGYVMVHMIINDDTWFLVRETGGISDFTGAAGKPMPMEPEDIERFIHRSTDEDDEEGNIKTAIPFKVGDRVRVKEGNFENQEGEVDGVDEANGRVTVIINIFGRSVPMELDHWQVEPL